MAAAKAENLTLVVHGPGDLRLVRREGEREAGPTLPRWPRRELRRGPGRLPLATGPAPPGPGRVLAGSWPPRAELVTVAGGGEGAVAVKR